MFLSLDQFVFQANGWCTGKFICKGERILMVSRTLEKKETQTLIPTIATCHALRIGWFRTLFGGLSMYLTIPLWVTLHLTVVTFLYQKLIAPLLKLTPVKWSDHITLDRHRIDGLVTIDKFNCHFCAYANGITTMLNREIDFLAAFQGQLSVVRYLLLSLFGILSVPVVFFAEIFGIQICYNLLIAPPLGLHRSSFYDMNRLLYKENYASQFPPLSRSIVCLAKNLALRFSLLLEQIESSWCPLHHLEQKEGIIRPKHHERFFRPHEIDRMFETLSIDGTVSPHKPLH